MSSWGNLEPVLVPVIVITVVALLTVIIATGHVSQLVIRMQKRKRLMLEKINKIEDNHNG